MWNKAVRCAVAAGLAALFAGAFFWETAPALLEPVDHILGQRRPAVRYYDRDGRLFHADPGWDHQWRFPLAIGEVPEALRRCFLAVEDRRFYRHDGVDYGGVLRAAVSNLAGGRIVSGASTIPMQVARLADPRPRGYFSKLRQMLQARSLCRRLSKDEIFELYLNHLPFGGKIHGVEAAARYYFGCPVAELTLSEMALLSGIPQRPNAWRPDRDLTAARQRQKRVLTMLAGDGVIAPEEIETLYRAEFIHWRDWSRPAWPRRSDTHYTAMARREAPDAERLHTAFEPETDAAVRSLLALQLLQLHDVADAAAVVIDNASGEVIVLVGSLDFRNPLSGQVNAAAAGRQPGSALKPFIYALAVESGLITAATVLDDSPLSFADYRPGNYDKGYAGKVPAAKALADSLNTPAVRLVYTLTPERVLDFLGEAGLAGLEAGMARRTGLALALGGVETSLLDLTGAAAGFARGGVFIRRHFNAGQAKERRLCRPGTAALVNRMLRRPLPGAPELDLAWKTGTSNGNHDAWCLAWNTEYTVGVWFGNKSGRAAADLVGVSAAAPAAGMIFKSLYRDRRPAPWPSPEAAGLAVSRLCAATGLAATPDCPETLEEFTVAAIPLIPCPSCRRTGTAGTAHILTPQPGHYRLESSGETLRMRFSATPGNFNWYLDNRLIGRHAEAFFHQVPPGRHRLRIHDPDSGVSAEAEFSIR